MPFWVYSSHSYPCLEVLLSKRNFNQAMYWNIIERNFQSEGGRFKGIITLRLHYMVSICKGRRLLVDNHIVCAVDVDVDVVGLSRVITDRDTRLINGCGPPPENVRSLGRNVRWRFPVGTLRGRSFSLLYHYRCRCLLHLNRLVSHYKSLPLIPYICNIIKRFLWLYLYPVNFNTFVYATLC